jgi:hypothetical protein
MPCLRILCHLLKEVTTFLGTGQIALTTLSSDLRPILNCEVKNGPQVTH